LLQAVASSGLQKRHILATKGAAQPPGRTAQA
jgi:hypothetical protein